jgi:hypothetical protein
MLPNNRSCTGSQRDPKRPHLSKERFSFTNEDMHFDISRDISRYISISQNTSVMPCIKPFCKCLQLSQKREISQCDPAIPHVWPSHEYGGYHKSGRHSDTAELIINMGNHSESWSAVSNCGCRFQTATIDERDMIYEICTENWEAVGLIGRRRSRRVVVLTYPIPV